jgi:hypothetical protein
MGPRLAGSLKLYSELKFATLFAQRLHVGALPIC